MKAKEIVNFKRKMWENIADNLIVKIVKRARVSMKNYKNEKFAALSKQYAKYKKNNMRTFTDKNWKGGPKDELGFRPKGTRLIGVGSGSISSNVGKANMTLTGETLDNLAIRSSDDNGAIIGWNGIAAERVKDLYETKNFQIVGLKGKQVVSKSEEKYIVSEVEKTIAKNIKKYEKNTVTINLGK